MADTPKSQTEAPTSAATTAANDHSKTGLTSEELQFVTFMSQYYNIHGKVMTSEIAITDYYFELEEFNELIDNEKVQSALKERGVIQRQRPTDTQPTSKPSPLDMATKADSWKTKTLLPEQLVVANVMLDLVDQRSYKKKLQDLGIPTTTYAAWLKDPVFYQYLQQRSEEMLKEYGHEAHLALLAKVQMGDMTAIKYMNELTGRYKEQAAALNQNGNTGIDFQSMIIRIIEIINDEVNDPDVAIAISERLKGLISATTMANQLTSAEIIQPKVMQARELTPSMAKLMESGQGYE